MCEPTSNLDAIESLSPGNDIVEQRNGLKPDVNIVLSLLSQFLRPEALPRWTPFYVCTMTRQTGRSTLESLFSTMFGDDSLAQHEESLNEISMDRSDFTTLISSEMDFLNPVDEVD